jgi:hypothetical protein
MFKATHKRRATTLSKTFLTAGLLGGAALSTLSAGSAQAAWDFHNPFGYICTIAPTMGGAECDFSGTDPTPTPVARPGSGLWPEDKILTLLGQTGMDADDTISFTYQSDEKWQFRFDPSKNITDAINPIGHIDYKIKITDPDYYFETATLSTLLGTNGDYNVTKKFYTDDSFTTEIVGWALENPPTPAMKNIGGQEIFVRDSWSIPSGSTANIDVIQNDYTQVPAPLPLLGVGAAFGSIRKLRKFSSQLKTFSMG